MIRKVKGTPPSIDHLFLYIFPMDNQTLIVAFGAFIIASLSEANEKRLKVPIGLVSGLVSGLVNGLVNGATGSQIVPYLLSLKMDRDLFV